jgi:hypothetical protein
VLSQRRSVLHQRPELIRSAREFLAQQDSLLLAERLLAWTDDEIAKDLRAYVGVSPADAIQARDMMLRWLRLEPDVAL